MNRPPITPRVIRLRDAPYYLGMDVHRFNREVRPQITVIKMGNQGIAFDRLDLDKWFEVYKPSHACPATNPGGELWVEKKQSQDCINEDKFGTSTKSSVDDAFAKALAQVTSRKQKGI